jgi:hypothetical protein
VIVPGSVIKSWTTWQQPPRDRCMAQESFSVYHTLVLLND